MRTSRKVLTTALATTIAALAFSSAADAARRTIDVTWTIDEVNATHAGIGADQNDLFKAGGRPFGRQNVETTTKAGERGSDIQHPEWLAIDRGSSGDYHEGVLTVKRRYLETSESLQRIRYSGTGRFTLGAGRYREILGRITRVSGTARCTPRGCTGSLRLVGWADY